MKKILSAALCVALLVGTVSATAISASAAETTEQAAQATVQTEASSETLDVGGFTFDFYGSNRATITGFNQTFYAARVNTNYNNDHRLVIPSEIENSKGEKVTVTEIKIGGVYSAGWKDGKEANTFTSVFIPRSVKEVDFTFSDLPNLKYVTFEEGSEFSDSFAYFTNCTSLQRIGVGNTDRLPDGVISIHDNAFKGCISLQSITFSPKLYSVGSGAFKGCTQLKSVTFETFSSGENKGKSNLTNIWGASISGGAFENCTNLQTVQLPVSTNSDGYRIHDYCFKNTALTGINIPENVTSIGKEAFAGTKLSQNGLKTDKGESYGVAFFGKATTIADTAFGDVTPIIAGYNNSNADTYSFNHNLKFVSIGDWNPFTDIFYKTIGDLDDDGKITSLDSLLILRNSVKLEEFSDKQMKIADVDGDGKITSADALEVLRNSVGFKSYNIGDTIKK